MTSSRDPRVGIEIESSQNPFEFSIQFADIETGGDTVVLGLCVIGREQRNVLQE